MGARDARLAGVGVLVTRPAHQAQHLAELIEADGGTAIRFPTIEIAEPADTAALSRTVDNIADIDVAIFVSPNAVDKAINTLRARGRTLPSGITIACVGPASARALERFGIQNSLVPARSNSEALLELPPLARVAGKRVVIFRGDGGRELLGQTLSARGAHVVYAECYRRVRPEIDPTLLVDRWARGYVHIVSITSSTGLENLYGMLGTAGRRLLFQTPAVVVSASQAARCRALGFSGEPIVARDAADEAILEAIRTWRAPRISL